MGDWTRQWSIVVIVGVSREAVSREPCGERRLFPFAAIRFRNSVIRQLDLIRHLSFEFSHSIRDAFTSHRASTIFNPMSTLSPHANSPQFFPLPLRFDLLVPRPHRRRAWLPWSAPLLPGLWWLSILFAILTFACLAFYRDFNRPIPTAPNIMVAPADGKVTEITRLDHYAPFNGPALKIGIFLSVLDVPSPCPGAADPAPSSGPAYEKEGLFLDARRPDCD